MSEAEYNPEIRRNYISMFHMIPRWAYNLAKRSGLFRVVGFFMAFTWLRAHKMPRPRTMADVLRIFYFEFLRVPPQNCEVVKLTSTELVTRCDSDCPILDFARRINVDTRDTCRVISEPISNWFMRFLNNRLEFKRNYKMIRPYSPQYEETIILRLSKIKS
jgi:hypothetical protein